VEALPSRIVAKPSRSADPAEHAGSSHAVASIHLDPSKQVLELERNGSAASDVLPPVRPGHILIAELLRANRVDHGFAAM
jgi:hypothetical protein